MKIEDELPPISETADTTTQLYTKRGLLLDTRSSSGLPNAKVTIYGILKSDSSVVVASSYTDSAGYFKCSFRHLKFNGGFIYTFSHPNPVFMNRTYKNYHQEKVNDSTELYYLHRKSGCRILLKNTDGKQKNVMLFNANKNLSKVLMGLRKDTSFTYLLQDYEDIVYFDYFPQRSLQSVPVKGSTSGDTIRIEFNY